MSLRDEAVADMQSILGDGEPVTLTSPAPASTVYTVNGQYARIGMSLDAEGMPMADDKSTLTVSLADLAAAGLANAEDLKKPGWTVGVLDSTGTAVSLRLDTVYLDRTVGLLTAICKRSA